MPVRAKPPTPSTQKSEGPSQISYGMHPTQDTELNKLSNIIAEYTAGNTELAPKDIAKRKKVYTDYLAERDKLRNWYDSFFEKKAVQELYTGTGDKEVGISIIQDQIYVEVRHDWIEQQTAESTESP